MPAIDPVTEAHIWLQDTLSAHAGITSAFGDRIHRHPAPRDEIYPLLTYAFIPGKDDLMVVGTHTLWSELLFLVTGYVEGNDETPMVSGVAAIYDALHGKYGETDNACIVWCVRERPWFNSEDSDSVQYIRNGGEYTVTVRAKS